MKTIPPTKIKAVLFILLIVALVCIPFVIWGESFVFPFLHANESRVGALMLIAIILLIADSIAPVPATLVIMFLAAKAGWVAGVIGGTLGLSGGVLTAAWIGRSAVGRLAPKFFPEAELARLRVGLQDRLALTLGCLRSVPVLAETSVILAAATGIPLRKIVWVTLLPNLAVSVIYSVAADDSFITACVAFLATMMVSYVLWRCLGRRGRA